MDEHTVQDTLGSGGRVVTLVAVATLVICVATAAAAGPTTVRLAANESVTVSQTTTVDVVVEDVDGGVGAYNVSVAVNDPSIARITDVELKGDPSEETRRVTLADDGSSATMVAALADTADTGRVTIATVTVRGEAVGSTPLDLTVTALGDERGRSYTPEAEATSLTIEEETTVATQDVSPIPPETGATSDRPDQSGADTAATATAAATNQDIATPPTDDGVGLVAIIGGAGLLIALVSAVLLVRRRTS